MKLYIAGRMTGIKDFNYPAFNEAQRQLEVAGYEVLNPARQPDGMEYADYLALALADVFACDAIALLPDWDESPGARAEVALADALGKDASEIALWQIMALMKRGASAAS